MNYLVIMGGCEPFYTNWFEYENNWMDNSDMIVFNLLKGTYTTDGKNWHEIKQDHL